MSRPDALSPSAIRLVLAALEAPLARLSPSVIKQRAADARQLMNAGIIKAGGHEPVATASDDFSDTPLALTWDADRGSFGYFSPVHGWREVPHEQLTFYEVDVARLLSAVGQQCGIATVLEELVPLHFWAIGAVRLGKRPKRTPIMFGRRLQDSAVAGEIEAVLRDRPSPDRRIILTSTSTSLLSGRYRGCTVVAIWDVLRSPHSLAVDPVLLGLRYDHVEISDPQAALVVSAGGTEARLLGRTFRFKRGTKQQQIIQYMFERYSEGRRWIPSAEILEELGLGDNARIRDIFKGNEAWGELIRERDRMCGFCLPESG
jgi:hypothetical protein